MAAMTNVVFGPAPTDLVTIGQSWAPLRTQCALNNIFAPFSAKMSASYATGGDTLAIPATEVAGMVPVAFIITPQKIGANWYSWNASQSAPKIQAWSAFNTEIANATDLSAVTITGFVFLAG